jgi:hypothetical protein
VAVVRRLLPVFDSGSRLGRRAVGHFAKFAICTVYTRLAAPCILDVFPVFVRVENVQWPVAWDQIQVSVQLQLESATKGIQADLKVGS